MILFLLKTPRVLNRTPKSHRERLGHIDFLGVLFFAPGILCLLLALQWGGTAYNWSNIRIIALVVLAPILLVIFGFIQWKKQDRAMLPLHLVKQSTIILGMVYAFSLASVMAIAQFYVRSTCVQIDSASA